MNNLKDLVITAAAFAAISIVPAAPAWSQQTTPLSAESSPSSDTRANREKALLLTEEGWPKAGVATAAGGKIRNKTSDTGAIKAACMAAALDLERSREMIAVLDDENSLLKERLETEKRLSSALTELTATQKQESAALRSALAAKDETIAAKNNVIAAQDQLTAELKAKRSSPWRRLGDILIGAATIAVLK
jgi:hypothetical protein